MGTPPLKISLEPADYAVIGVYLTALVGIGMWVSWRRRGAEDLFLAGHSLGWPNVGLSIFGTNVSPSFMIASCGIAYTTGMVTANFEWLAWWFLMMLAMLFVPYYLGTGLSTMPQFLKRRFGPAAYEFVSWYTLLTTIVLWLGGTLYASGILLAQVMGWELWQSVLVLTVIATSFTMAGGLAAVVITDSFQVILMIAGSAALTVIALVRAGGIPALVDHVPADYWKLIRPAHDATYPWPAMFLGYPVLAIWFWCTDQTIVQRVLGARDIRQGQLGAVFAAFLKILTPLIFMLPGILCLVLHPGIKKSDDVFMTMVDKLLSPESIGFSGVVGLIVAVLIAALISTVDSGLNSFSTVFTLDIYVRKLRPLATAKETTWVGRAATVAAAAIGVLCALAFQGLGKNLFDLLQGVIAFIAPPMAAVFLIGVLWRRATSTAAVLSLVLGAIVSIGTGACCLTSWPELDSAVLTLSGPGTPDDYRQVLRSVKYTNDAEQKDTTPRMVTIVARDEEQEVDRATLSILPVAPTKRPVRAAGQGRDATSAGSVATPSAGQREPDKAQSLFPRGGVPLSRLRGRKVTSVRVTITNLLDGHHEVLAAKTVGTDITAVYDNTFWPHYLLLSFYLFAGISAFMVAVSLATRNGPDEERLPTLKETYAAHATRTGPVWALWTVLGAIMLGLYAGFQALSYLVQWSK